MEQYYFLQKNGNSQGPYRFVDLKKQTIQADDLVWRNNTNEWAKASDLEELSDIIIKASSVLKTNMNITELYYFIQQEGSKKGPFKLSDLQQLTIYFDELVWRSDSDHWKKASEFEELSGIFIFKPPPTPKEQKIAEVNRNFIGQIISQLVIFYAIASFLIGIISFGIAQSSWEKSGNQKYSGRYELIYQEGNHETMYANNERFWFRPFKAFGSTIYLRSEEQMDPALLLWHLILSSYASLSFIFVIIGIIYYAIKRTDLADKPANTESIN